jgi:serine/threonine-protein kinase RsbW
VPDTTSHSLALSTPPDDVNAVHDLLEQVWSSSGGVSDLDRFSFETALIELASNVIRHADAGGGVTCRLAVTVHGDVLEATLTDSGEPGDIELAERHLPDDLAESGRGIPLIKALVDVVEYGREADLNRWYISRSLDRA